MYIDYTNRIFGLDVVRSIAILLVLCSHSTLLLFPESHSFIITIIQFFGTIGVDLFFVLSGYLIGTILLNQLVNQKTKFKDFGYFLMRRWFRTLPNYYLILLVNIIVYYVLKGEIINGLGHYILFTQNFSLPQPDFFTESWSLSIEEWAYAICTLTLFFLAFFFKKISSFKMFLLMVISILILITCFKIQFHFQSKIETLQAWSHQFRKVVLYRIDAVYYGFLGAFFVFKFHDFLNRFKYHFFIVGILVFFSVHSGIFIFNIQPQNAALFFNLIYLPLVSCSLLLLFPLFINWKNGGFLKRQITLVSLISYSLYLVNYSLVLLTIQHFVNVENHFFVVKVLILLGYWLLSFGLAYVLFRYFERPIMEFRNRFFLK